MKPPFTLTARASLPSRSCPARWSMAGVARRLWPLLLPACLLLPALTAFPFPSSDSAYSDLAITHYPNAVYLRHAISSYHTVPLWSPAILSGYPFAANPLAGLWYPPGWLALVLPLPLGFNLLVVLHLLWGGIGFYLWMRLEGLQPPAALLGALAFEAMPKIIAHYGAGHITLIYAFTWTPWLLYTSLAANSEFGWKGRGGNRGLRSFGWALPAIIAALILLADVRWAAYAVILWWLSELWIRLRVSPHFRIPGFVEKIQIISARNLLGRMVLLTFLAILLAAPLVIPLIEFANLSTRSDMTELDVMVYSLPPSRLLGLFFPDPGGFHEWILYPGWVILSLALFTVLWKGVRSRALFWIIIVVVSLGFSLGENLPLLHYLARIPLFDMLRVPPRALFLAGIAFIILAGYGLNAMLVGLDMEQRKYARLLFVFLIGVCASVAGVAVWMSGAIPVNFAWGIAAVTASSGWLWVGLHQSTASRGWWLTGLLALCLLDIGGLALTLYTPRPALEVLSENYEAAKYLSDQSDSFRVYSPSYSLPQQSTARSGLSLADGVDPMQLRGYAAYMEKATGIPFTGYSVTLPPFESGDPNTANTDYTPQPDLLGLLNVRYVVAEYDVSNPDLILQKEFGSTRIYENSRYRPRAWVQPEGSAEIDDFRPVEKLEWRPNRIEIRADGPGLLVLSELSYPGWQVIVDGKHQEMLQAASILRAVSLGKGSHRVVFQFKPLSLYAGIGLSLMGAAVIIWLSVRSIRRWGDG